MARQLFRLLLVTVVLASVSACKEDTGVRVKSFAFKGNKAVKTSQLKSVLATGASSKLPWGTKRYFSREQFEADLKRITAFYTDRGYPDARVSSFDANLSPDQTSVDITINISEGEPVVVERIVLEGFETLPEAHRKTLDTRLPLRVGQPLDRALLQASREAALDELRDHGHPYASVRLAEEQGGGERKRVITLRADPGPIAHHGEIQISGNATVSENVIRRQLTFKPGDLFRQSRLQESQRKLYSLELFEFANIEPVGVESKPEVVPTRVTVTKSKHKKVNFGVGYGSEEKARAQIDWRHVNAFGGAQTVGVLARYSSLDRGVRLTYKEPYIFSPRWSLGVNGQMWHTDEPAFTLNTTGGRATLTRQFARGGGPVLGGRPSMALSLTYANEHEDYTISNEALLDLSFRDELIALGLDPRTGQHEGQRSALSFDASRNTTDNLLDAKRGYVASVHFEQAGSFLGGTYDYREVTGEGRIYQKLGNIAVFAVQARAGAIDGLRPAGRESAVLQALLPRRRDQPSRLGALRGGAAQWRRPADRRHEILELLGRAAGAALGQPQRCGLSRRRHRLGRPQPRGSERFGLAVRRRSRPAVPDADRADPRRPGLSAEPDSRSACERKARDAALPIPLQHRPGFLDHGFTRIHTDSHGNLFTG